MSVRTSVIPFGWACIAFLVCLLCTARGMAQGTAVWTQVDNQGPTARWRHAIAVDPDRKVLVLFGGNTGETDTWEQDIDPLSPTVGTWRVRAAIGMPGALPGARANHTMVYDQFRRVIVMAGGHQTGVNGIPSKLNQVWEYNGAVNPATWTMVTQLPQERSGHAMVYDSRRDRIVIYGGVPQNMPGDRIVLERPPESRSWISVPTDSNGPGTQDGGDDGREGYFMAFDPNRQRTLLIAQGTNTLRGYEWNGSSAIWTEVNFIDPPPNRLCAGLVYDVSQSAYILCGGNVGGTTDRVWSCVVSGPSNDTVGVWSQRSVMTRKFDEHAVAFDPIRARMLVSGGLAVGLGSPWTSSANPQRDQFAYSLAQDSWTQDWRILTPSPRTWSPTAYDPVRNRMIMHGGDTPFVPPQSYVVAGDTWSLSQDGVWTPLNISGPGARRVAPMVYDEVNRVMIMYGGLTGSGGSSASRDLWELTLDGPAMWANRTPAINPAGQRYTHVAAYDSSRHQMVVHGGTNQLGERLGDTVLWSSDTRTFQSLGVLPVSPGLRADAAMAYDQSRHVCVLFGGLVSTTPSGAATLDGHTWEWDGTTWRDRTPLSGSPPARRQQTMVYDERRHKIVMLNGVQGTTQGFSQLTEVWEYDDGRWAQITQHAVPQPAARLRSNAVYSPRLGSIMEFGGATITGGFNYANGQTWFLRLPGSCTADFNNDGDTGTDQDIEAFFRCLSGSCCATCPPDADFNGDGDVGTDADIESFFRVLAGGNC